MMLRSAVSGPPIVQSLRPNSHTPAYVRFGIAFMPSLSVPTLQPLTVLPSPVIQTPAPELPDTTQSLAVLLSPLSRSPLRPPLAIALMPSGVVPT